MKLDEITIHRFRGLRDVALKDLSRVNLLIGPNDSGKTSILEAVAAFARPQDLRVWLDATWRREILPPDESFFLWLEWMFPHETSSLNGSFDSRTRISGSRTLGVKEANASFRKLSRIRVKTPTDTGSGLDEEHFEQPGALIELSVSYESAGRMQESPLKYELWDGEGFVLHASSSAFALPLRTVTPTSHRSEYLRLLSQAAIDGVKSELIALLRNIDSDIRDVLILSPAGKSPVIFLDYARVGLMPLSAFGEGVRRVLNMALELQSAAGGVLLVDEIESSIHVTALGPIFSWIVRSCEKLDIQLFATTHSLEAVDAMLEAEASNLSLIAGYRLQRRNGLVEAQRLGGDLLHGIRYERGLDVRL